LIKDIDFGRISVMEEKVFIIHGQKPLSGTIEVSGYKNAAGSVLAATLLSEEDFIIKNLPLVDDILNLIDILKKLGSKIEWIGKNAIKINNKNISLDNIDFEKVKQSRVSVLLIGSLLARFGNFKISRPGGDRIGLRPITTHIDAFKKLGVRLEEDSDFYYFYGEKMKPATVILKEFSVTATENLMMATSLLDGETVIKMAALEPQIQDLGDFLIKMGVQIEGLKTHTLKIKGKKRLKGAEHEITSDPTEAATFIIAGCLTPGEVVIKNLVSEYLDSTIDKLKEIGVNIQEIDEKSLIVKFSPELQATRVQALPFPGFPTDILPLIATLLTQANGKSLIHDPMYENRLNYIHELRKMGADIEIVDPHRAFIFGKTKLKGVEIGSWDIRAGASLVLAGILAEGKTTIKDIYQIDRGYEKIDEKLKKLGADIERISK
jgi:UDP-N-acetylglucosamine 1-carboxyvinyltransferase